MKYLTIKLSIVLSMLFLVFNTENIYSCTTAVISGKYTKDGRPMLWKNRDTWAINNVLMYFEDGKYPYLGLVNSKDIEGKSVWIGMNSTGFAIMNSASYNLNLNSDAKNIGTEGRIMKEALATCSTLEEFEEVYERLLAREG